MNTTEETVNRVHLYHIVRKHCANIGMGDAIVLHGARISHKTSKSAGYGERHYTYVIKHQDDGWVAYIKVKANNELFSAKIYRRYPDTVEVYDAVNEWMAVVCS